MRVRRVKLTGGFGITKTTGVTDLQILQMLLVAPKKIFSFLQPRAMLFGIIG